MKKPMLNEREINQKMFRRMRESGILRENFNAEAGTAEAPPADAEPAGNKIEPSENDVAEAQEKFRQNVAPDTQFTEFTILPEQSNVIFKGVIPGLGEFIFEYTQKEGYAFNTDGQVTMSNINFDILKKMVGYFTNWKEEMATKLLEYKQNGNNE